MSNHPPSAQQPEDASLQFEQELDDQLRSLERALQADPDSVPMLRAVEIAREQRNLVRSLVDQALRYEDEGHLQEALERWQTLLAVHPDQSEVASQVQRLFRRIGAPTSSEPASEPARAADRPPPIQAAEHRSLGRQLSDSVAGLQIAERSREAMDRLRNSNISDSAKGVGDALGWMQSQVNRASGSGDGPPIQEDSPERDGKGKPLWMFLAAGIGVAALLAMIAGRGGTDHTPGPSPLVREVNIQAAPRTTQIFVDGEPCGAGTCDVQLEAGIHEISGRLPGYAATRQSVAVETSEGSAPYGVRLALEPLAPALELTADLESAKVTVDGEAMGQIEDGSLRVESLPFGEHEIRLASSGLSMRLTYRAEPGKAIELTEPLEAVEIKAAVATGLGGTVRLYSAAENALVSLDGGPEQSVADGGLKIEDIAYGAHEAVFSDGASVGFETDMRPTLAAALTSDRNVGALRVSTGIDGATVYLNGRAYRRKTSRGGLLIYLAPRPYKVRVEKEGFRSPPEQTAEIVKGRRASLDMRLEPEPQTATLYVRGGRAGARVSVDGKVVGTLNGDGDLRLPGIDPGQHTVEIQQEGFEPKTVQRDFPKDSEVGVDGGLEAITGTLRIAVSPSDASPHLTLEREGQPGSRSIDAGTLDLVPGTYTVSADAPGYKPFAATVRVSPRTTKTADIQLEKIELATPKPRDLIPALDRLGWSRHGDVRVRSGGGFIVAPAGPGPGVYRFSVIRQRGKLQWAIGYRDSKNHVLYQVKKNEVVRTVVEGGEKTSEEAVATGTYSLDQELTFRIRVRRGQATLWLSRGGEWTQLDEYAAEGVEAGRFAFNLTRSRMLGRADQIGVREFSFTPAD